jgi:multiple sugar transport system ATP-binding protein
VVALAEIQLENVRKTFGKVVAVHEITLTIRDGEFLVLLGPSGCGKTTTLRCIAGLEVVDRGRILIGGRDVTHLPPSRRGIAMVFQSYAVFPHMNVFENIAFGLRVRKFPPSEIRKRVQEAAELLQIGELLQRYPAQLSGGQRQRVAVARAIVMRPEVLLMDEPLSNLDALLRLHMRAELKRLHREIRSTTVYVTHDQVEALSLGDRVAVMREGRIVQCDTPEKVYTEPQDVFVGSFIGSPPMNFLQGTVVAADASLFVEAAGVRLPPPEMFEGVLRDRVGDPILLGIRPENIEVHKEPRSDALPGQVVVVEPIGFQKLLTVQVHGATLKVTAEADKAISPGEQVWLRVDPRKIRVMDPQTGGALSPREKGL